MASPYQGRPARQATPWQTAVGLCLLVLAYGGCSWPFVKKLGIEVDEALVGNGIYQHGAPWYSWDLFGNEIPVMILTYIGALKTWLMNLVFAVWPPGPVSLRLPTVLVGAGTILLFWLLLDRTVSRRAAWAGAALLATDPLFIITDAADYGPTALQHAFKLGALVLLVAYHRRPAAWRLAGAFFLLGIALWDKAVFVWLLAALAVAGVAVFWREIRVHVSLRNIGIAAGGFVVGALPFLIYNIARPLETFRLNAHLGADNPFIKVVLLKRTLDGSGMFGYITSWDGGPRPVAPRGLTQHLAFAISRMFGAPHTDWMMWAALAAVALTGLVWRTRARRPLLFALLFVAVTWSAMFLATGAGGAVHHVILLWPFPAMIVAVVVSELAARFKRYKTAGLVAVAGVLCFSNLLVVNQYYVELVRNGPGVRWTDAFPRLTAWLYDARARRIAIADWGILETLNLMSEGELPIEGAGGGLRPDASAQDREEIANLLAAPDTIWVTHGEAVEQWPGSKAALLKTAAASGYSAELLQTIQDRNGRAIFEIFRFRHGG